MVGTREEDAVERRSDGFRSEPSSPKVDRLWWVSQSGDLRPLVTMVLFVVINGFTMGNL